MTSSERLMPTGFCWCGCGQETKRLGSFFVSTHDRKAEAAILEIHHRGSIAQFLVDMGYGPNGKNLTDALDKHRNREKAGE